MQQEVSDSGYEEASVEADGARVHYLHAGSGHPMLLIHGLVGSSANWTHSIAALAQHASVYALDLVNMGKSQRVEGLDTGLVATAARIAAVMDALHLPQADLVGHSHGGAIALMFASLYPRRVSRLILFAPANPYCRASHSVIRTYSTPWGRFLASLLPYLPARLQRIALGPIYGGPRQVVDKCLQETVACLKSPGTLPHVLSIIRTWFAEMATLKTALRRLKRIPTLLIWGDRDSTVSLRSATRLKRKLRGSTLVVVPHLAHSVFEEAPAQANRIMLDWLDRNPPLAHPPAAHGKPALPKRTHRPTRRPLLPAAPAWARMSWSPIPIRQKLPPRDL